MSIRSQEYLKENPCLYKLKDFDRNVTPTQNVVTNKVKQQVPKLDENGNVIYKTVLIPVRKGCACKGNKSVEMQEQRVPETTEVWVDATTIVPGTDENKFTICKLYGTVKRSICENCKTYKKK